jgi:hypothetical protein
MVFLDGGSTGVAKKESLADLVTEISGAGVSTATGEIRLTATDGILSLYGSDIRSSGNLKYTRDITWGTDVGTEVVFNGTPESSGDPTDETCTITHNLNTKYVFVSVIEFSSTGSLNFVDGAQQQVDMNFKLTAKPLSDNTLLLWNTDGNPTGITNPSSGTGIYTGSVFKVTIMG